MQGRLEIKISNPEHAKEGIKQGGLMRMRLPVFLHASPQFRSDDHRYAGDRWVWQFFEPSFVA